MAAPERRGQPTPARGAGTAGNAAEAPAESRTDGELLPGVDYTTDALGRVVFTAHYNRRRGYCCFLACRHCPWGQSGRTPAEAQADLCRRLESLEQRLVAAGAPLAVRGYRNGLLAVSAQPDVNAVSRAEAEATLRQQARDLLTVLSIVWED